jgi:hypothetical protein
LSSRRSILSTFIKASVERRINSEVERSDSWAISYLKAKKGEDEHGRSAGNIWGFDDCWQWECSDYFGFHDISPVIESKRAGSTYSGDSHKFQTPEEINFLALKSLKYLSAVVDESMRIHPAAPTSQPRVVPDGGCLISGHRVPGGLSLIS